MSSNPNVTNSTQNNSTSNNTNPDTNNTNTTNSTNDYDVKELLATELFNKMADFAVNLEDQRKIIDAYWANYNAFNIFAMIICFTILEMGYARYKSQTFTIIKNLVITCCVSISWYLWGFAFAYGESSNEGIGKSFFADDKLMTAEEINLWVRGFTLSVISTLIATSIISERAGPYILGLFSIFYSGVCFPLGLHWAWNKEGWLKGLGFVDFSGAAVVHMAGASAGLAALLFLKDRKDRFAYDSSKEYKYSSKVYIGIGGFLLWALFFNFNSGQLRTILPDQDWNNTNKVGSTGLNNVVASAISGIICLVVQYLDQDIYDISKVTNGILVGVISMTGGGCYFIAWPAICISVASVAIYYGYFLIFKEIKLDDPRDGFALHFGSASMGLILTGFFHRQKGLFYEAGGKLLGAQFLGLVIYSAFPFVFTCVFFLIVKCFAGLEPTKRVEQLGEDVCHCGGISNTLDNDSAAIYYEQILNRKIN